MQQLPLLLLLMLPLLLHMLLLPDIARAGRWGDIP